jgi:hypothetical protein
VTTDLIELIQKELTTSLGDIPASVSVDVREGWGDIFCVTVHVRGVLLDQDDVSATLQFAVDSALGDVRHIVEIKWEN